MHTMNLHSTSSDSNAGDSHGHGHGQGAPGQRHAGSLGDFFVNSGTHQVPLFEGFPPEDMTRSSNPLAWLLSNLTAQEREKFASQGCCYGSAVKDQSAPSTAGPRPHLQLSSGASAMVNIVDPRLRQFCHDSVAHNPRVPIVQDTLLKVLRVTASKFDRKTGKLVPPDETVYKKAYSKFEFYEYRSYRCRSLESAIPHNIMHEALIAEINEKFTEKMSE
jgi:hypothetical protein